ncbi:MAG: glutamate--cysteine ligase [Alphaproteobacteria bacterium]|nr:glutamate--cysteine ligase [Alphaproteobacteria bacterium]
MEIISHLDQLLKSKQEEVQLWLADYAQHVPPYIYGSVDLRHSGAKIAPVDTNLYPGGFNNISQAAAHRAAKAVKRYIDTHSPQANKLLIVPENHTRNLHYLENVACLRDILIEAGYETVVGTLMPEVNTPLQLETSKGRALVEYPLERKGNVLQTREGFVPDAVVINNDFTPGVPDIIKNIAQPTWPPVTMGWYRRRKREHFAAYDAVVRDFAEAFDIDHWLISAYHRNCGMVDFRAREGMECVATNIDLVLDILRVKYAEYGVKDDPYVFIKADSGTYGMGVMTARSGEEVLSLNKKFRQKIDVIKEGFHYTEVVIQEGVPSIDKVDGFIAEPMIYVVDATAVGGAFRVNDKSDAYGNLNAPGMSFYGMCDQEEGEKDDPEFLRKRVTHCNFGVYALIARLATLAAAREEY